MKKTKEIKLMIIENFIDHFTSDEEERHRMKVCAETYVEEDHVDEIEQAGFIINESPVPYWWNGTPRASTETIFWRRAKQRTPTIKQPLPTGRQAPNSPWTQHR